MIDYDASRLPLGLTEWQAFLHAIEHADDNDEAEWVEWKRNLDLTDKNHIATIAKAIVAFANRDPSTAAERIEGRGLLIVGLAPGDVPGVTPRDPAELDRAIRHLLGPDGPRFGLEWIPYADKTILVVVVAAPQPGDPIHHIARSSGTVTDGNIYVRRPGRSDPATGADIRALTARLTSRTDEGLDIQLIVDTGDGLPRCTWRPDWIEEWLQAERQLLLYPLKTSQRAKALWEPPGSAVLDFGTEPEPRTPEEYKAEVDAYLNECRDELAGAEVDAARYALTPVVFRVVNHSNRNYSDLEVRIHIEGDVEAHEALNSPPAPEDRTGRRPRRWGPIQKWPKGLNPAMLTGYTPSPSLHVPHARPDIQNGGSTKVTFLPVHVRPHSDQVVEDELVLLTREPSGSVLRGTWTATATNVHGRAQGTIEIPVADGELDLSGVLAHEELRRRPE